MAERSFRFQRLGSKVLHDFPIKEWGSVQLICWEGLAFAGHSLAERDKPCLAFFGKPSHPQAQQGEIRTLCFIFKFPCFLGQQPDPLFFEYSCLWFNFLWVLFFWVWVGFVGFFLSITIRAKTQLLPGIV